MAKKQYQDIFADVDAMNPDAAMLSEHTLSLVDDWIDTGSLALNAICSGSMYKGLPVGRVIGLGGPTGCGKTFIMNQAIGNFQKKDPDNFGVVFDSEMGEDARSAESVGADPSRIRHYPIESVTKMRNQIVKLLDNIIAQNAHGKFFIGIDSLGNLGGAKELNDAAADKEAADMGTRAKEIRSMLRVITYRAARARTTVLFNNHTYENPTEMFKNIIKQQSGGGGPQYIASLLIQLGVKPEEWDEKNAQDVKLVGAKKYSGVTLHAITAKNRFIPQFLTTDLYLNFKNGLQKYGGLFELSKEFGILEGDKSYSLDGEKLGYYKEWRYDDGVWTRILPKLEKKINEAWCFGKSEHDELQKEVKEIGQ
jgi:RecA/RadA recombinase